MGDKQGHNPGASCPDCGKIRYYRRRDADIAGKRLYLGAHMSAYRCGDFWHIGNLMAQVIKCAFQSWPRTGPELAAESAAMTVTTS